VNSGGNFRRLAKDYAAANHDPIAAKLIEVARDFEAKAAALARARNGLMSPSGY